MKTTTTTEKDAMTTRIAVIEDHPIYRAGLVGAVRAGEAFDVVMELNSVADARAALEDGDFDLIVVDIELPDGSGLDIVREFKTRWPQRRALVVSMHDERVFAGWALQNGADGYLMKTARPEEIRSAIAAVLAGRLALSESIRERLLDGLRPSDQRAAVGPESELTEREFEVFFLLGRGQNTKEIASHIGRSAKTVESHIRSLRDKLRIPDRDKLLRLAALTFAANGRSDTALAAQDELLIRRFEAQNLSPTEWTHEAHVRVAYWYLSRRPFSVALRCITDGIHRLNRAHGNAGGYHETVTRAWATLIRRRVETQTPRPHSSAFVEANPSVVGEWRKLLRAHYSSELLDSDQARREWVEPDLEPLPEVSEEG